MELYSFDKRKVKTASIVSFGLRPLIKLGDGVDSLFSVWTNADKNRLLQGDDGDYQLRDEYVSFCAHSIQDILLGFYECLPHGCWKPYDPKDKENIGVLTTTFINGCLNLLRLIIENDKKLYSSLEYQNKLKGIERFNFKEYKSSHYREMGKDLYNTYFAR